MGLKQEELITRYFEHRMLPAEEQNFLISLAASDELRLAFRSHIELMKAVRQDKDDLRSVAQVRNRTLTALGLSATAVMPFIEQELVRSAKSEESSSTESSFWHAPLRGLVRTPKLALGTGLMLGFLSATTLMSVITNHSPLSSESALRPTPAVVQPDTRLTTGTPEKSPSSMKSNGSERMTSREETIPAAKGLNTVARPASSATISNGQDSHLINSRTETSRDLKSANVPEVTKSRRGTMDVNKVTIKLPNDSAKAR